MQPTDRERTLWSLIGRATFWATLALLVGATYVVILRPTFAPGSDGWDYAQEARQLATGKGFTSLYTYPVHLTDEGPPFPVHWRLPLYPVLGALLLRADVSLPFGFLLVGVFSHAALVMLAFLIARSLHSMLAGCIAASVLVASPLLLDPYDPGLNHVPATALTTLVWYLLLCRPRWWSVPSAALAAAGAWYLRAESALLIPFWIGAAWLWRPSDDGSASRSAWSRAAWFFGCFVALVAPWVIHQFAESGGMVPIKGNPTLLYTPEYPGYSSARGVGTHLPTAIEYVVAHPKTFLFRYVKDLVGYIMDPLRSVGVITVGLVFAAGLDQKVRPEAKRPVRGVRRSVVVLLAAAVVIHILVISALERSPRFLVVALPTVCILLGMAVAPYLERARLSWLTLAILLAIVGERSITLAFDRADAARRFPAIPTGVAQQLKPMALNWGSDALVLSDVPDWVAWHFERPALLLPGWEYLSNLVATREVSAIYLSTAARGRNASDHDSAWLNVIDHCARIQGFDGPTVLDDGSRVYVRNLETGPRH